MGCDIHFQVQAIGKKELEQLGPDHDPGRYSWDCTPRYHHDYLPRNYSMFGLLAGIRGSETPIVAPRGWPKLLNGNLCHTLIDGWSYYMTDEIDINGPTCCVEGKMVERSTADQWLRNHSSLEIDENYITDPDLHTPTWLTCDEYRQALKRYAEVNDDQPAPAHYFAIGHLMKAWERRDFHTRIVLAFDN